MRYDVKTLAQLREAAKECDAGDRIVIFFPDSNPQRFRVQGEDDKLQWEHCDRCGDVSNYKHG